MQDETLDKITHHQLYLKNGGHADCCRRIVDSDAISGKKTSVVKIYIVMNFDVSRSSRLQPIQIAHKSRVRKKGKPTFFDTVFSQHPLEFCRKWCR
jgi:hypothetical protein